MIATALLAASLALTPVVDAPSDLTASRKDPVMTGPKTPYRGEYWRPEQRAYTLCVQRRESNHHWFSTNRSGGYFGAFQFSAALARGSTWMITPELKSMYGKKRGRQIARQLRRIEMHKWRPYFQHMAFATVLNWEYPGSGKHHWAGGRFTCRLGAS